MQGTDRMGIMALPGRITRQIAGLPALIPALVALAIAPPPTASAATVDPRWLPWIGCWIPVTATSDIAPAIAPTQRVCVVPSEGSSVEVVNVTDGDVVSRVRVDASGERRPVSREGCDGWESAQWSSAPGRVYLRSELTCAGGIERASSGILAIASPGDWVDVEVVTVRGQRSTRIVRYRSAPDSTVVDREIAAALGEQEMARRAARLAGAALPAIADVIEASRVVDQAAVEAWLLQRMPRFTVEARELRQLADARVPGPTIDLVVALSRPEMFHDRFATRGYTLVRLDATRAQTVATAVEPEQPGQTVFAPSISAGGGYSDRGYPDRCDRCSDSQTIYYEPYPVYYPSYPYGYGYGYGYYPYWPYGPYPVYPSRPKPEHPAPRPPVIVNGPTYPKPPANQPPPPVRDTVNGRAVNGRGYTRPASGSGAQPDVTSPEVTTPREARPRGLPESSPPVSEPPRTAQPRQMPTPPPTDVRPFQPPPSAPPRNAPSTYTPPQSAPPQSAPPPSAPPPSYSPPPRTAEPRTAEPRPAPPPPKPVEVKPAETKPPEPKPPESKPEPPPRTAKPRPPAM